MSEPAANTARERAGEPAHEGDVARTEVARTFIICNKKGLHARASAKFVQMVEKFDAEVRVKRGNETVGGTSIMGLMMLAAASGTSITIEASGRQAADVVDALAGLIQSRFGEAD